MNNHDQEPTIHALMISGLEEIVGQPALKRILQNAQCPVQAEAVIPQTGALQAALEDHYGGHAARGLALQAGRSAFNALLRQYGSEMGLHENAYRMLPTPRRIPVGLVKIARTLCDLGAPPANISQTDTAWVWKTRRCLFEGAGACEGAGCAFLVGLIQEYLSWASGGRVFPLRETECARAGNECCSIRIEKRPLD